MAAISGTLSLLLVQWKGPTHGPGWAAIVQDGRSSFNFNKKFQNLVFFLKFDFLPSHKAR